MEQRARLGQDSQDARDTKWLNSVSRVVRVMEKAPYSSYTQAVIVVMLVTGINDVNVAISMFMFNFCWVFVDIYQAATIANVDRSGRFPALIPAAW